MGTSVNIHLIDDLDQDFLHHLADEVFSWLCSIEQLFSVYQPRSEISLIRRGELTLADCSPEVRTTLDHCARLWRTTGGYFDIYATGALDPCGFVRGWAIQAASDRLIAAGCANHYINAGTDVRVRGHALQGQPWHVRIRHPWQPVETSWILAGTDLAVATSDIYENGRNIINPHRGLPATELRSVTVSGPDLGLADAYSTAAFAMGLPALTWLARLPGYESAVVTDDGRFFRSDGLPVPE